MYFYFPFFIGFAAAIMHVPRDPELISAHSLNGGIAPTSSTSTIFTSNVAQTSVNIIHTAIQTSMSHISTTSPPSTPYNLHLSSFSQPSFADTSIISQASPTPSVSRTSTSVPNSISQTQQLPSPSNNHSVASFLHHDLPASVYPISSTLPTSSAISKTNIGPTFRYVLIAVSVGIPTLVALGFLIMMRWRRANRPCGSLESKELFEHAGISPVTTRNRKSTRFSSPLGACHGNTAVFSEKDRIDGKRQLYATSIHSTAGIAGVGAHRCGRENVVPPMIQYVKLPEFYRSEGDSKVNFENPFGTPPPADGAFVIAPSRVSPQISQAPMTHLVDFPSPLVCDRSQNEPRTGGTKVPWPNERERIPEQITRVSQEHQSNKGGQEWDGRMPQAYAQPQSDLCTSRDTLPRKPPKKEPESIPPPLLADCNAKSMRASVPPSVYGGIESSRGLGFTAPKLSPALSSHAPSPLSERTPVLPYLIPPPLNNSEVQDPPQSTGPIIVIEPASSFDSICDHNVEFEDQIKTLMAVKQATPHMESIGLGSARRAGLIGLPLGYIPPSTTISTISSYSIPSVYEAASGVSPSVSSADYHESPTSSALKKSTCSVNTSTNPVVTTPARPNRQPRLNGAEPIRHSGNCF